MLRIRQQTPVGVLTIWPTIPADLALTFYKAASNCFSISLSAALAKKESGKLNLNFIGGCSQILSVISMVALIQINNHHQRESSETQI